MKFVKSRGKLYIYMTYGCFTISYSCFEQVPNCKIFSVKYYQRVINTSKQFARNKR